MMLILMHLLNDCIRKLSGLCGATYITSADLAVDEDCEHCILNPVCGGALANVAEH